MSNGPFLTWLLLSATARQILVKHRAFAVSVLEEAGIRTGDFSKEWEDRLRAIGHIQ